MGREKTLCRGEIVKTAIEFIWCGMKTKWISLGLWETANETKKNESNNCFIIHCFEENNDKHTVVRNLN